MAGRDFRPAVASRIEGRVLVDATTCQTEESYRGPRDDLLDLIPLDRRDVLDLGCNEGALGLGLKHRQPASVVGAEIDRQAARVAQVRLDDVYVGDMESSEFRERFRGRRFDAVICGDALEHLREPWALLDFLVREATSVDATFIVSLPNVGHWSTFHSVWIRKTWPRNQRGIHDRAHLRWFTESDARQLLMERGLAIDLVKRKYRLFETIHPWNGGLAERALRPILGTLLVHQLLLRASKGRL